MEPGWSEIKKVQFATKRLDIKNKDLLTRSRLDCPTFKYFKDHMILVYGTKQKPWALIKWNEARRFQGTTFVDWLMSRMGTLLLDKTTEKWDSGSMTNDERNFVLGRLKLMVPAKVFEPYTSHDGDWDHEKLARTSFMDLMKVIKKDEQFWYLPTWKEFIKELPIHCKYNDRVFRINSLAGDSDTIQDKPIDRAYQNKYQNRNKDSRGRNSPNQHDKPKYHQDHQSKYKGQRSQAPYQGNQTYKTSSFHNKGRGGQQSPPYQKNITQQTGSYQNQQQKNQGSQQQYQQGSQRQYQQGSHQQYQQGSQNKQPASNQNYQGKDNAQPNRGRMQSKPGYYNRGSGNTRGRGNQYHSRNPGHQVNAMGYDNGQPEQQTDMFYPQTSYAPDQGQNNYRLPAPLQQHERLAAQGPQVRQQQPYQQFENPQEQYQYPRGISQAYGARPKNYHGAPTQDQRPPTVGVIQNLGGNQR